MVQYKPFILKNLFELQFFSNVDYFFSRSMGDAFNEVNSIVLTTCALVSKSLSQGHICIDINELSKTEIAISKTSDEKVKLPDFDTWIKALQNSSLVSNSIKTPLVLDSDYRLYLSKYFDFQNRLGENIAQRLSLKPLIIDQNTVDKLLEFNFNGSGSHILNQKNTVKNALRNHFTIISGGPGTGKTFVVAIIKKIILLYAAKHHLEQPKIICTAPTGKAASKMENGKTIHSILKPLKNRSGFYYNKNNPLQVDVIIIDEASMIDILLMVRLLEAVPVKSKVIMLGDQHQLSSIQAGSVFSDICSVKNPCLPIFFLDYNFRSKGKTGIENLAKAINNNDYKKLKSILTSGTYTDVVFKHLNNRGMPPGFIDKYIVKGFKPFMNADTVDATLEELDAFKILCAHNSGDEGTLRINHVCEKILLLDNNFDIQKKPFKKIVMVNINDYKKGLFNGDTGVCLINRENRTVFFKDVDSNVKQYRLLDLPGHDTAFAITIHKSQGSEFKNVLIILPDKLSPVVTRQLLYTGVTRAKEEVMIIGNLDVIKKAIGMSVKRNSGVTKNLDSMLTGYEVIPKTKKNIKKET